MRVRRVEQEAALAMPRVVGDRWELSHLCRVGQPSPLRQTGRGGHMTLSRQWKTLSIRVLHFPDRMTGCLPENISYEKPCDARQSLNIPVDSVADGAGETARRRPKGFFNHFFHAFGLYSADMVPMGILVEKEEILCNGKTM